MKKQEFSLLTEEEMSQINGGSAIDFWNAVSNILEAGWHYGPY